MRESTTHVFESLGCSVEDAEPDFTDFDEVFKIVRAQAFLAGVAPRIKGRHAEVKDTVLWEIEHGGHLTPTQIMWAETKRTEIYHRMRRFMESYDFFVLPSTQVPPFDVREHYVREIEGVTLETYIDWMKSCYFISIVGNPAISVPCGFTPEAYPSVCRLSAVIVTIGACCRWPMRSRWHGPPERRHDTPASIRTTREANTAR